jgi:four helix bundle protein
MTYESQTPEFMPERRPYQDLIAWRQAIELAAECHTLFHLLPDEERFNLGDEILRTGVAIPSNIAASQDCESKKAELRCLDIARCKLRRLDSVIAIAKLIDYFTGNADSRARILIDELDGLLDVLIEQRTNRRWDQKH